MKNPSIAGMAAGNKPNHLRTIRIHACMRALYPNKRTLRFDQQAVEAVVAYFETNFPGTPEDVLLATVVPSDGDLTWAGLSVRDRTKDVTAPKYPPEVKP